MQHIFDIITQFLVLGRNDAGVARGGYQTNVKMAGFREVVLVTE
jgi:hypothetical protein